MKKLKSFINLSFTHKCIFLMAYFSLPICQICINSFNFRYLLRLYNLTPNPPELETVISSHDFDTIKTIVKLIRTAAIYSPLIRAHCLAQALISLLLLGRLRNLCILHLGVNLKNSKDVIRAHAWLSCSKLVILGDDEHRQFNSIARFGFS